MSYAAAERYLQLPQPKLSVQKRGNGLEISSDVFARQVSLEVPGTTGAVFEDNYFDLLPRQTRVIKVLNTAGGKKVRVKAVRAQTVEVDL